MRASGEDAFNCVSQTLGIPNGLALRNYTCLLVKLSEFGCIRMPPLATVNLARVYQGNLGTVHLFINGKEITVSVG